MNTVDSIATPVQAMISVERMLGPGRKWHGESQLSEYFIQEIYIPNRHHLAGFHGLVRVSFKATEINAFLEQIGIRRKMELFHPYHIGIAGESACAPVWSVPYAETLLEGPDGNDYPALYFPRTAVEYYQAAGHPESVISMGAGLHQRVFITPLCETCFLPRKPANRIDRLRDTLKPVSQSHAVTIPKVWVESIRSLPWARRMITSTVSGQTVYVQNAIFRTTLTLASDPNSHSDIQPVRVRHAKNSMRITDTFLVWLEREGIDHPVWTAVCGPTSWRSPKEQPERHFDLQKYLQHDQLVAKHLRS
jgi:hypothetical protein